MKKILTVTIILTYFFILLSHTGMASGDKVRGENGAGTTVQECVNFGECPYGDTNPVK